MPNTLLNETLKSLIPDERVRAVIERLEAERRGAQPGSPNDDGQSQDPYDYADRGFSIRPQQGDLIYLLCRGMRATRVVEFATSVGMSTLYFAASMRDNGGGRVIGSELVPAKVATAKRNLSEAGLAAYAEIREGDALQTLARDLPDTVDFVLLDGAKALYPPVLSLLEGRLRDGALIVADNADDSPEYLARIRSANGGYLSIPFGEDVELSMRLKPEGNSAAPHG